MFTLTGLMAIFLGCLCIYAASPNQRCFAAPWPLWPARAVGSALLALGWWGLAGAMQPVTAIFVFVTTLMLVFAVLPYFGALLYVRHTR